MSRVAKMVAAVKAFDRRVWPSHRVALAPEAADLLRRHPLIVADVGSADGPEEGWLGLREFIHFLTFEPNPRPAPADSQNKTTNFPLGLWSEKCRKKLFLTRHVDSASVVPINTPLFAAYQTRQAMEVVGATEIDLDALDNLLAARPELSPEYLKIDVEGADLEVLKGAVRALAASVMGIKVETSFLELHVGAPLLWEIDAFLRERGFVLFYLGRNHWIRANGLHGYSSRPQLIWGDGYYFLGREPFLARLAAQPAGQRAPTLAKFIVILLRHGIHDYAWDVVADTRAAGYVSAAFAEMLQASIKNSIDRSIWYFAKSVLGVLFALVILAVSCPFAESRKRGVFYLQQRAGRLGFDLWRLAATEGSGHNACVGDPFV